MLSKAYHSIVNQRFHGDYNGIHDISKLGLADIRTCVSFKNRPEDDPFPKTKVDLRERYDLTKDRHALTEVKYLLFANTTEEVIGIVTEELYAGSIEQNNVDDNENDKTDS